MISVIQRVSHASIEINQRTISEINIGLVALVAVEKSDTQSTAQRLAQRLINYRIFPDQAGLMNKSLKDLENAQILVVPQFTLAADTSKGNRPGFALAEEPVVASKLFDTVIATVCQYISPTTVKTGVFGADMKVSLINDGPATFILKS